jgi:adenosylcobinamide-GDP ribazoletransferase
MYKNSLNVLSFLTIVRPAPSYDSSFSELGKHGWTFPLVGACLGLILFGAHELTTAVFDRHVSAALVVILWIYLTGGLHLDGWVDCWDALSAPVDPDKRLAILKDSRIGTFGAAGLMSLFLVKTLAVASPNFSSSMLVTAPIVARTMMLVMAYGAPHTDKGMAAVLVESLTGRSLMTALTVALPVVLYGGIQGIVGVLFAYGLSAWFKRFAMNRINAINGDVLGAICELSETILLLSACGSW